LKKGEIHTGTIEKVLFPNRGLATVESSEDAETENQDSGVRVIVKNVIPGQHIRYRISKKRSGRCEGQLLEVLDKSPLQSEEAGCSLFPVCGGCMYRTMTYEDTLQLKEEQIRELLTGAIGAPAQQDRQHAENLPDSWIFEKIQGSPDPDGYRNKMEFSFGDAEKDGPLTLGLHKKNSRFDVLPVTDCRIVHGDFNLICRCVLEFCREKGWTYMHRVTHQGYLRHLMIRRAAMTGEIMADLVTTSRLPDGLDEEGEKKALDELAARILALPLEGKVTGLLHTVNDSPADVVKNDRTDILYGRDWFNEKLLGLSFRITPFSFFQTNSKGAEVLYRTVREYVGDVKGQTVFDLYSGTGTIAQVIAPVCSHVVGVEIVPEAVEAARENAGLNGLENCEFLCGDVLRVIDEIEKKPDTIILDPPRDGIHPKAMPKILAFGVDRIVYISCKATSLARDLPIMIEHGYRVEKVRCVDMFPFAVPTEVVALLTRNGSRP